MKALPIVLRYAGLPEDLSLLAHLNKHLIEDEQHRNPMSLHELQARMHEWLSAEGGYTAVIIEQPNDVAGSAPAIAGYCLFTIQAPRPGFGPSPEVYVRHFYVGREHRRRKIGRRAFLMLSDQFWPRDARIILDVLTGNYAARQFWAAMGFTEYALTLHKEPK